MQLAVVVELGEVLYSFPVNLKVVASSLQELVQQSYRQVAKLTVELVQLKFYKVALGDTLLKMAGVVLLASLLAPLVEQHLQIPLFTYNGHLYPSVPLDKLVPEVTELNPQPIYILYIQQEQCVGWYNMEGNCTQRGRATQVIPCKITVPLPNQILYQPVVEVLRLIDKLRRCRV